MKTAIVGAGKGCRSLLEFLLEGGLTQLSLDVRLVCDIAEDAPGLAFALEWGIPVCHSLDEALAMPGLELVVELTGRDDVADEIYHRLPAGVRVFDHMLARIFWDLIHTERHLRAERAYAQKILDSIPDIVLVVDRDKRVKAVNAAFTKYTGRSRDEALGELCHWALCRREEELESDEHFCPFEDVLRTGQRRIVSQTKESGDGRVDDFELTMTPLRDESGEIVEVVEALHPIRERVRLRQEVEAFAQRFRQFIDSAHDLISIKDLDGRYQVVNRATAEFLGVGIEDAVGKKIAEIAGPKIAGLVIGHDREVIEKRTAITYDEMLPYGGREHYYNTVRFPLFDYFGDVVGVCTISRDVTREKALQRELRHADKLASLGKLAAGIAHEINNPLTGILSFAEDLLEEAEDGDIRADDYRVIIRETLRCRGIVRNLLDFSRQSKPRMRRCDPNAVAEKTLDLVERLATFRDIDVERRLDPGCPAILGDAGQLQQVVLNLLVNATEKMPGGGELLIETGATEDGLHAFLTVADRGEGIPDEVLERIFQPFFSTKKTTQGLGLAVSWGIVERHGGRIEAGNRERGGAYFRVILPAGGDEDE
ncbi:MAG: PAS domain-containing protein [Planctomycetota bacterium]